MRAFGFKVIPAKEGQGIPVSVAGKIMVDVQSAILHIGEYQIANELRLQGSVPEELLKKFILIMEKSGENTISSAVPSEDEFSGNLLDLTSEVLESVLDAFEKGFDDEWYLNNFTDPKYRSMIFRDLCDLSADIDGFVLLYGSGGERKEYSGIDYRDLERFIESDERTFPSTIEGVLYKSDTSNIPHPYRFATGNADVDLIFDGIVNETEAGQYCCKGPCVITGIVSYDENGNISKIEKISEIDEFPYIIFKRIISADRDMLLLNPVTANIDFDMDSRTWTLGSDLLGISISKQSWDNAVLEFHDYFMFLWEIYAEETKEELSEEEVEIREYLLSLIPKKV